MSLHLSAGLFWGLHGCSKDSGEVQRLDRELLQCVEQGGREEGGLTHPLSPADNQPRTVDHRNGMRVGGESQVSLGEYRRRREGG